MRIHLALCCVLMSANAFEQQTGTPSRTDVVLRGSDYAFSISVPANWNLDTAKRAYQAQAKAVLYTTGTGKYDQRIIVFIATKKVEGKQTLPNLISYRLRLDSAEGYKSSIGEKTFLTKDRKKVILVTTARGNGKSFEAYIEETSIVVVLDAWPIDGRDPEKVLSGLKALVQSYSSISIANREQK